MRTTRPWSTVGLTGLALLMFVFGPVGAAGQDDGPQVRHPEAAKAISSLKSPYCPGFMLDVCTSSEADVLRDSINTLAEAGNTSDELIEWMLSEYGEEWRAIPKAEGSGLVAWLVPPLLFVVGIAVVVVSLKVMRRGAGPEADPSEGLSDEEEARLARALHQLDVEEEPVF